jgi:hypothetical protein
MKDKSLLFFIAIYCDKNNFRYVVCAKRYEANQLRKMRLLSSAHPTNSFHIKKHPTALNPRRGYPRYSAPSIAAFGKMGPIGGSGRKPLVFAGPGMALRKPSPKARSAGNRRNPGRLFFGYFLLAKQKKVSRSSVREPTLK